MSENKGNPETETKMNPEIAKEQEKIERNSKDPIDTSNSTHNVED
jgi:hypothetical protein